MAITNGYATLNDIKERLQDMVVYTADTISFTTAGSKIQDSAYGLGRFNTDDIIQVSGSTNNDGYYTLTSVSDNELNTSESVTDESAGQSITIHEQVSTANPVNPGDDALLEEIITAASRWIDNHCNRRFYSATETRYYTPMDTNLLFVDDLLSVTTLKVDEDGDRAYETTWASTDYDLLPLNASLNNHPYSMIRTTPEGSYNFPVRLAKSVEINGSFGYASSVPAPIKEACTLISARLFKRKDAILGVTSNTALGEVRMQIPADPDVEMLLSRFIRTPMGGMAVTDV